jgi:hypothetical protein
MQMSLRTFAIATSALACATLLSFSWSEQRGVSLAASVTSCSSSGFEAFPNSVRAARRCEPRCSLQKLGHGGLSRLHLWPLISFGILSAPTSDPPLDGQ